MEFTGSIPVMDMALISQDTHPLIPTTDMCLTEDIGRHMIGTITGTAATIGAGTDIHTTDTIGIN